MRIVKTDAATVEELTAAAKEVWGERAYIPRSKLDTSGGETIGYLDSPNGAYAVVLLGGDDD